MVDDLRDPPHLNIVDREEVAKMISYSQQGLNQTDGIDFDKIITDAALREHFGYLIPKNKVLLDNKGKPLKKPKTFAPGGALKKSSNKRANVPETSALVDAPKMASKNKKTQKSPLAAAIRGVFLQCRQRSNRS